MVTRLSFLFLVLELRGVVSVLQSHYENHIMKIHTNAIPIVVTNHEHHKIAPVLSTILHPHVGLIAHENTRKSKGINIPVALPVTHQFVVPAKLHVIPINSNVQATVHAADANHATKENTKLPIISQTLTHSNVTHSLIPFFIPLPYHNQFVPIQDLTVIPLHGSVQNDHKFSQFRQAMEKKDNDEEEPMNRFRSFYGGFGTGLFFGGHGAGHGFYAYG